MLVLICYCFYGYNLCFLHCIYFLIWWIFQHDTVSHLFGEVVLYEAVEWHRAADLQQCWRGARTVSAHLPAQVTRRRAAALLLTLDFHSSHKVIRQQLSLHQVRQVSDEGYSFQVPAAHLLCHLCGRER